MKKLFLFLLIASLFVTGCSIQFGQNKKQTVVAGVFKSLDKTNSWGAKNLYVHAGGSSSLANVNVSQLIFDPQDEQAIYLLPVEGGLFYTYNAGSSWMRSDKLGDKKINSLSVDSENKCIIYAALNNTIVKSVDCSRSWQEVYIDTRADKTLTAVGVDSFNNLIIYAGNNSGEVFKSFDGGAKWQMIEQLKNSIKKILIDPYDTRIIYIATKDKGIFKTTNGGGSWNDINEELKKYSGALEFQNLIFDTNEQNNLLLISKYGLIKSIDGGSSWEPYKLITPPASVDIYGTAINPKNKKEIIYSTKSTFYQTTDGGTNWVTKRLPTNGTASVLLYSPSDPNIVYMGVRNLESK